MKVLIYGINHSPELTGIGKYTGEMASWFAASDSKIRVVTAPPYYPSWRMSFGYKNRYRREYVGGVGVFRCPLYVPRSLTTTSRLLHLLSFSLSSLPVMLGQVFWRPDVILVVAPSLFCAPLGLLVGALCGARTVLHIQDYELDAMFGLNMMSSAAGRRRKVAAYCESWLLQRFDRVSTISISMMQRALDKNVDKARLLHTPNWVDTNFVRPDISGARYREEFGFLSHDKVVLYSGNLGQKQGLSMVLEAAAYYMNSKIVVQFVIVGNGAQRQELVEMARKIGLTNLHFGDLVAYDDLPELLAMADVHLVVQRKGAADMVLPSKLTSILSLGGYALITAEHGTELAFLVEQYQGIAELVEPENLSAFIQGLDRLLGRERAGVNLVAREYALSKLAKEPILEAFLASLTDICAEVR
jgi:colanic acid biosynthesis glycosyl transferase WcaI